jgi:hypothetical protein
MTPDEFRDLPIGAFIYAPNLPPSVPIKYFVMQEKAKRDCVLTILTFTLPAREFLWNE